jgi:MoaA/NifB/PqqE/SkfB family radical SAM enzyme
MLRIYLFHFINWVSRSFFASRLSYAHIQAFLFNNSFRKLSNLLRVYWDIRRGRTVTSSRPYILILETTNICNLRCPFCLTGKGITGGRELRHMSYEEARSIIDQVADTIYLLQLYTWGDPLLNKDTIKIIEYAKSRNVYVMLSTNATAMTPAYNEKLLDAGIDYVTVAIDGGSDETYSKYRIGGEYSKVLSNVRSLLQLREQRKLNHPFVEWQFIVFRHNEHEVDATEKMAYQIGINKFTPLPAYVEDKDWHPVGEQYRQETFNPERLKNCERPWSHLNIRADGGVASCCYEFAKKDDFGDIRKDRFDDIWNNRFFTESRLLLSQHRKGQPLSESALICHDCIESGVRPSYVEVSEVPTEQLNLKKVAKNKAASDATGKKKPVTAE